MSEDTTFVANTTPIASAWLNEMNDHVYHDTPISPAATVHDASVIANTPTGTIAATTVQAAINELDTEKAPLSSPVLVTPNLGTPSAGVLTNCTGLPASSVINTPAGSIAATDIQTAVNELDTEKAALAGATFTGLVNLAAGANIASAATVDLTAATGNCPRITGTTATSAITMNAGQWALVVADGAWPLTYHATTNKLNGGADYTCAAGDMVLYNKDLSGVVHGFIIRANGAAVQIKPSFSVHKNNADQTGVVTSTWTKVTWPTEEFDTNSNFASNAFTPTVAGKYLLSVGIMFTTGVDQTDINVIIYKNGALFKSTKSRASGTGSQGPVIAVVVDANGTTDYFEVYVYHTFGSNATLYGDARWSFFTGSKID